MANTVVGIFDDSDEARVAVEELVANGFLREDIDVTAPGYPGARAEARGAAPTGGPTSGKGIGEKVGDFFSSLFGGGSEEAGYYSEAVRRGGTLVAVHAKTGEMAERASDILDRNGAFDVDERAAYYRETGYAGYDAGAAPYTAEEAARERELVRARLAAGGEAAIPVVQEELRVGKRQVERGGVRVRSRVVEKPVEETVRLREERVVVERRPADRPASEADLLAASGGAIEVTERGEEAVVDKRARVVEEVVVGKQVEERAEAVRDTVRRTDVEVEQLNPEKAKPKGGAKGGR